MRIWLIILSLLLPSLAWAVFPETSQLDTCTRANEGPPLSANWTVSNGTGHKIVSNKCVSDSDASGQASTWNTFTATDAEVAAQVGTIIDTGKYFNLFLRLQTVNDYTSNMYQVDITPVAGANNDVLEFWKRVGGTFTQLGASVNVGADFVANTTKWGGRVTGVTIEGFYEGTSVGTRTDSDVTTAGYIGLSTDINTTGASYSGFWGGSYPLASGCDRIVLENGSGFVLAENSDFLTLESGTCGGVTAVPVRMLLGVGL